MNKQLIITPRTKILQLLQTYPELEEILIQTIPVFEKLRNPVLRKTVASVTNLQQAATIGHIRVENLINTLRQAAGQDAIQDESESHYIVDKPSWFDEEMIAQELDARSMLAVGEHPVNQVMADLANLKDKEIFKLTTPFLPAPLIDKASSLGFEHWIDEHNESLFFIYFNKSEK